MLPIAGAIRTGFSQSGGWAGVLVATVFFACVLAMDVWPLDPLPYRENQRVSEDIHARVGFRVPSDDLIRAAKSDARDRTPATFQLSPAAVNDLISQLRALQQSLKPTTMTQPSDLPENIRKEFLIDPPTLAAWMEYAEGPGANRFAEQLQALREELLARPIVNDEEETAQVERRAAKVILVRDGSALSASVRDLVRRSAAGRLADELAGVFDPPLRQSVANFLRGAMHRPTYTYDQKRSERDVAEALAAIDRHPPEEVFKVYPKGSLLLQAGDKLTPPRLEVLRTEHQAYLEAQARIDPLRKWVRMLGRAGVLALVVVLLAAYVARYDLRIVGKPSRALAVAGLALLMLALHKIVAFSVWNERVAVLLIVFAAFVLSISYTQRFAIIVCAILSLLMVFQVRGDLWRLIVLIAAATATALQVREIRSRSRIIHIGAATALVVFITVWAVQAAGAMPTSAMLESSLWAAGFALLASFLIQGVLPVIEWAFGVVTSLTLLEWCDASKPLLKRLAMEAPGTFNHSLQLGAICEAAAEAIGARGLLARVGAYYHDIGKINKPDYFIENQFGSPSRHAKLSPAMSLLIVIGHVKDGLELAREYGLPRMLHEFIASHHGTTLVHFFYQAATEQRKAESERAPDEVEFRYPGPKPRLREVAILMLADAAESSVRSMSDPTPGRIENQVHTMVTRRLMDGQLDECDLTLRQVYQIEASLTKSLIGIYHSRIAYPTPAGQKPSAAELSAQRAAARSAAPAEERPEKA